MMGKFEDPLKFLKDIGTIAAKQRLEDLLLTIFDYFSKFGKIAKEKRIDSLFTSIVNYSGVVAIESAEEGEKIEIATNAALKSLEDVGILAAELELWGSVQQVSQHMRNVAEKSAEQKLDGLTKEAVKSMGEVGIAAAKRNLVYAVKEIVEFDLRYVGKISAEQGLISAARQVAESIGDIGKLVAERKNDYLTGEAVESLGKVGKILIEQDDSEYGVRVVIKSIGEVGVAAFEWRLFSWNNASKNDIGVLLRFLRYDLDILWAENAKIQRSAVDGTISISDGENSAEITIDENEEKVTLKSSDGRTYDLIVKKENGELNIYQESKLKRTTYKTIRFLGEIGEAAAKKDGYGFISSAADAAYFLGEIGERAAKKEDLSKAAKEASDYLGKIRGIVNDDPKKHNISRDAEESLEKINKLLTGNGKACR